MIKIINRVLITLTTYILFLLFINNLYNNIYVEAKEVNSLIYFKEYFSNNDIIGLLKIKDTNINVISINGDNEYAKTFLHNSIRKELSTLQIAFLPGKCTPHTQLTPLGLIQDVLLNIFNIPNFCLNKPQLKKDSIKFFKQDFPTLSTDEVYDLINILYPFQESKVTPDKSAVSLLFIYFTLLTFWEN